MGAFSGAAAAPSAEPPRCPFAGKGTELPPGHPPVPGMAAPTPAPAPALPPALADTVRTMAERGIDADQIAAMLKVDAAAVRATIDAASASANTAGKIVGDSMQMRLDELLEESTDLCCPVTLVL